MSDPVPLESFKATYLRAVLAGDGWTAFRIASDAVAAGAPVRNVQFEIVAAAQEEIGRLWLRNEITIANEHLATGISQVVLARLLELRPATDGNGRLVYVACVEGERHDMPARLVADFLAEEGFDVRFLGADVPTVSLVKLLQETPPDVLALSATMSFHLDSLRAAVVAVREALPNLPILIGGNAVTWSPHIPAELGVITAQKDPIALIATLRQLCGLS